MWRKRGKNETKMRLKNMSVQPDQKTRKKSACTAGSFVLTVQTDHCVSSSALIFYFFFLKSSASILLLNLLLRSFSWIFFRSFSLIFCFDLFLYTVSVFVLPHPVSMVFSFNLFQRHLPHREQEYHLHRQMARPQFPSPCFFRSGS